MKLFHVFILCILMVNVTFPEFTFSQKPEKSDDKTLSPYFFVKSNDPTLDQLPLKSTTAEVNISGVIANVIVRQTYCNTGKNPLEAIYLFPASTRAAVYSMEMTVGDRLLIAKIQEKEQARKDYEQAKNEGKSASLLEQQRPNVFQMNVANIMPGDTINVTMKYTELLIPTDNVYEFVYPTVVGPRYSNKADSTAKQEDRWVENPYTHEGEKPLYTFDITTTINGGMPIGQAISDTHELTYNYVNKNTLTCKLKNREKFEGNRDYILHYRLTSDQIETGLLLFEDKNQENFFLAMIQPPKKVSLQQVPPREYIFIMDVSGSMNGFPMDVSKSVLTNLLGKLRQTDKFNIIFFAGGSQTLAEKSLDATPENIKEGLHWVNTQEGSGGTELLPALQLALKMPKVDGFARSFVISTDGYVDVEKESFDLIRNNLNKANFFAFGIGSTVNRFIIEGMARVGMGEAIIATNETEANAGATKMLGYIENPVLTSIDVKFDNFDAYDVEPLTVPDVLAERPIIVFGKWKGKPTGKINLTGYSGNAKYNQSLEVNKITPISSNVALRYLWARYKIQLLDDYALVGNNPEIKKQVADLGLKYNLLTQYTSFIAIDSLVRNNDGKSTTVKQPLPLPEGVNDNAVGSQDVASGTVYPRSFMIKSGGNNRKSKVQTQAVEYIETGELKEVSVPEELSKEIDETEYDSPKPESKVEEPKKSEVFSIGEEKPEFPGGEAALKKFIADNLKYPKEAKKKGIKGDVLVKFAVETDGSITNITIDKGVDPLLDKEALRVIQLMAKKIKWKPGKKSGVPVREFYTVPVSFN